MNIKLYLTLAACNMWNRTQKTMYKSVSTAVATMGRATLGKRMLKDQIGGRPVKMAISPTGKIRVGYGRCLRPCVYPTGRPNYSRVGYGYRFIPVVPDGSPG